MRKLAHLSLGKLRGKGSKNDTNHIESSKAGFSNDPTQSDRKHLHDPTHSDIKQLDDPTISDNNHSNDPSQSDRTPTQSDSKHSDYTTQSDKKHSNDMTQSDEKNSNDPTQSDKEYSDDPTQSDSKHSDDTTQSDKKHSNDMTQSDNKNSNDPTQSDKEHSDDPTQSDKEYSNEQTRNRMSTLRNFPLEDINSVTNNFASVIGEGFLGKIYEGQLSRRGESIDVAVRRLDTSFCLQEVAFDKEISVLSQIEHPNIVTIIGYCYEKNEMLIVSERVARGSLKWHLSDPKVLTWERRLQISIGVVSALSYLHNFSVIHHNINCDSILLDENWEAKISGFEYSMTIPAGGLDLAYEKLGTGTYKSDVFSIGIVLFELLCKREAFHSEVDGSFQASSAMFQYENGKLHEYVAPGLYSQMDKKSFNIFSKTAYNCLNRRAPPTMNQVLERLERALKVQQKHENNGHSTIAVERKIPDSMKLKLKSLEHMRIREDDILTATKKFSEGHIVSGGFGSVYIAELEHVDKAYCLPTETENARELPKKRNIVAIKRIDDTEEMAEQGFYAEIELLTSCKHSNIIPLVGFCDEGDELILIYEYASSGSLNYQLQKMSNNHNDTWAQRLKICLGVAKGLSFLHTTKGDRKEVVHRDIKSANILLDGNFEAKIGDFGLSTFLSVSKDYTRYSTTIAGTPGYMDPQYGKDGKLKKESDVYSFGVVMFEILSGTVAYDRKYNVGLALEAKEHFENKKIKEMLDSKIKEEITRTLVSSIKGPNQESLDIFTKIAYKCLAEEQSERPTMEVVVQELENALLFQENRKDIFQISFEDVLLATDNFFDDRLISVGIYEGNVLQADGTITRVVAKRITMGNEVDDAVDTEFKVLMKYRHENVIALLGYCAEGEERVAVYEYMPYGGFNMYVHKESLTWGKRLEICIDIASGLDFLHGGSKTGEVVIHRDIKSSNILLDADMKAKIADFGLCVRHPIDKQMVLLDHIAGTEAYRDPEYERTCQLSKECDIYSFGILLFEILLRGLAGQYLVPFIKRLHKEGKLDELVFESTKEVVVPQSLTIFRRIAIQCLHEKREERPTAREVIIQLKKAFEIQEKGMDIIRISLEDIKYATDNFSDEKCIGRGAFGKLFKGQLRHANGHKIIAAKRLNTMNGERVRDFFLELKILLKFTHRNVIGLEGYCDEMGEKIIVYEYAPNSSLDNLLNDASLTWKKRLEIGIDVASGLDFLHGGVLRREMVLHRDMKSSNILLDRNWKAKIANFGLSLISPNIQDTNYVIEEDPAGAGYIDPAYLKTHTISKAADIYSFGVVLFEILCGRLAIPTGVDVQDKEQYLGPLAKNFHEKNKLEEFVFEGIKEQIVPQSLSTFADIAHKCLHDDWHQRPTASEVVAQLKEAKEFQEDCGIWEPKLPSDYKEIIQQSKIPEICYTKKKEVIYNMLHTGILIQNGNVWFSLDGTNNRNEMISAKLFTYKNQSSQKWIHKRSSRFKKVPLMMDISNLKIQAHIKAQLLTPNAIYGVYLVFIIVEPNKISSEPKYKYVNLKYKMKDETLHAYLATWRKDKWMMVELYRFLNDKDDVNFEVLLESFSRYYCGSGPIYIEGIEFRAIDNLTHEESEKSNYVQQIRRSNSNTSQMQQTPADDNEISVFSENYDIQYSYFQFSDELFLATEMNGKQRLMLSAKAVLYDSSNVKLFRLKPSEQSRFGDVIEVLSQPVVRIKCKIDELYLSPDIYYRCYLIFKLSEKCRGLHCPVKVRGPLHRSNKVIKNLYLRSPNAWNIHDIDQVPKQREDGWMEVNVWTFKTKDVQRMFQGISVNLKLISYEGTMSGLIVCGLEFRPM